MKPNYLYKEVSVIVEMHYLKYVQIERTLRTLTMQPFSKLNFMLLSLSSPWYYFKDQFSNRPWYAEFPVLFLARRLNHITT